MGKDLLVGGAGNDTFTFASFQESLLASFDAIDVPMMIDSIDSFGTVNSLNAADVSSSLSALGSNHAATLQFGSRAFVAINDSNSGFDVSQDLLIEITGYTGDLNELAIIEERQNRNVTKYNYRHLFYVYKNTLDIII